MADIFVSAALAGELVGIAELESGDHVVRFGERDLDLIDRPRQVPPLRSARGSAKRRNLARTPRCRPSNRSNRPDGAVSCCS